MPTLEGGRNGSEGYNKKLNMAGFRQANLVLIPGRSPADVVVDTAKVYKGLTKVQE